jgi:hypothetical protein
LALLLRSALCRFNHCPGGRDPGGTLACNSGCSDVFRARSTSRDHGAGSRPARDSGGDPASGTGDWNSQPPISLKDKEDSAGLAIEQIKAETTALNSQVSISDDTRAKQLTLQIADLQAQLKIVEEQEEKIRARRVLREGDLLTEQQRLRVLEDVLDDWIDSLRK